MGRLADSLLLIIDCSDISYRAREKLFMNSRDRLRNNELRKALESELEDIIHRHPALRELKERRKSQEIAERLDDSKPLEDVLKSILKSSPSLSALFLTGTRLSKPHKPRRTGKKNGKGGGTEDGEEAFQGKDHPTIFKFKNKPYGKLLSRACEMERRSRIQFETDVHNDYFSRQVNAGRVMVEVLEGDCSEEDIDWSLTLHDGTASASVTISAALVVGQVITLQFTIDDDTLLDPFVNVAKLHVKPKKDRSGGNGKIGKRKHSGNGAISHEGGIQLPEFWKVREPEWDQHGFDRHSACMIIQDEDEQNANQDVYSFYINVDNVYLRTDMKSTREDPRLCEAKFIYGNVLIGLGLIKDYRDRENNAKANGGQDNSVGSCQPWNEDFSVEQYVRQTTRALSPFILPMIDNLGSLSEEDVATEGQIGDDE